MAFMQVKFSFTMVEHIKAHIQDEMFLNKLNLKKERVHFAEFIAVNTWNKMCINT